MSSAVPAEGLPQFRVPTRREAWWFEFRAGCFRALRRVRDLIDRDHRRHRAGTRMTDRPALAESVAQLWPTDAGAEHAWVLGKLENLRIARLAFDGVELRRGETLSFWAQLGRPSRRRGFVPGRELREGCLIPSIGGGLCQLSNALYDAALRAGLEVVERHAHSRTIPGSAAARDRDATVFWNYIDLRLRAPFDLRFEVEMDADALRVRIRGDVAAFAGVESQVRDAEGKNERSRHDAAPLPAHPLRNCASCGVHECFRNAPQIAERGRALILSDRLTPEEDGYLRAAAGDAERISPVLPFAWRLRARIADLRARLRKAPIGERMVAQARLRAQAARARLRPEHAELYVDQAWLPWLWRSGALAGRRYRVLMRGLPMHALHARLEIAAARYPHEPSLRDFRADAELLDAERRALAQAEAWLSPHAEMLALAGAKARAQPWALPPTRPRPPRADGPLRVYFPASSLVRKGALELAAALREISAIQTNAAELILPAHDGGEPARWQGIAVRRIADGEAALAACDVVVLPAWIEHQPRALLAAIAQAVPVIATPACGLGALPGWRSVPEGDIGALREALREIAEALPAPAVAPVP